MTGLRASNPADPHDHPLREALARGDGWHAQSGPALRYVLAAQSRALLGEAIVAQVSGMMDSLAKQIVNDRVGPNNRSAEYEPVRARLLAVDALREHCHALAIEWRLTTQLEAELALDPVSSPLLQALVSDADPGTGALAMATLAAQSRFAQGQRRMELALAELPAELFHAALLAARESLPVAEQADAIRSEGRLRTEYDEGAGRLALLARLANQTSAIPAPMPPIERAGVGLWLSALAARSGEARDRTACAIADPLLGRLLLTLRAAGLSPADAERQALRAQPDAELPYGLHDVGTREAAQWLAEMAA